MPFRSGCHHQCPLLYKEKRDKGACYNETAVMRIESSSAEFCIYDIQTFGKLKKGRRGKMGDGSNKNHV